MKNLVTLLASAFLIWRINELASIVITINALTLTLIILLLVVVVYVMGFNALHVKLIQLYVRFVEKNPRNF